MKEHMVKQEVELTTAGTEISDLDKKYMDATSRSIALQYEVETLSEKISDLCDKLAEKEMDLNNSYIEVAELKSDRANTSVHTKALDTKLETVTGTINILMVSLEKVTDNRDHIFAVLVERDTQLVNMTSNRDSL